MDTNQDEHPPKKRKRKAADDPIKKWAVVITGEDVIRKPGSNEVPMPTTITLAKINKDKMRRKEISFTLSKTEEDMKEILKETFPILAGTERFYCAKSAEKVKLDFGEKRCIWSGKDVNRIIKGDSVLYIFCEGEQVQDSGAFSTDSEQSEAHITLPPVGPNTSQITEMVPMTLALAPQPIPPTGDLPEQINSSTLVSQMKCLQITSEDTEIQESYNQASTETFTAEGSQSGQQYTPVTVWASDDQIIELIASLESEIHSGSISQQGGANYGAQNLIDVGIIEQYLKQYKHKVFINPTESPLQGGAPCIFTFEPELSTDINVKATFGNLEPNILEKTSLGYICKIPASPEMTPDVISVLISTTTGTILAQTFIEYCGVEKEGILQTIQRITSDPNLQQMLLLLYMRNNLRGKPGGCGSGRREDGSNDGGASGGGASGGGSSGEGASGGGSSGEGASGSGVSGCGRNGCATYGGGTTGYQYRRVCTEVEEDLEDDQLSCTQESDEHYFADTEGYSSVSSETDSALSDSESWDESLSDSSLSFPWVSSRSSKSQEAIPETESTQHSHKAVNSKLDVSHEILAQMTEGFTSEDSIGDHKCVVSAVCHKWNTSLPESKNIEEDCEKDDHIEMQDSSQEWAFYSDERTSHTLLASYYDTPVLCLDTPDLNAENEESHYQDNELFEALHAENAKPKDSESILSVTSNQQSATHAGPTSQSRAAQSPVSNPLWNGDSKLNMAPPQCSDEEVHSGQEWEESVIKGEGLASWFDFCENENAGKNERSRWEMSSIEPNKTDGGVEKDVFDSEEDLSQEQGLFSEQGNSHVHLSLPDDTSVQSRRPEVENEEIQDTPLFTAARNGQTDIVRLLIENGADVNKGGDTSLTEAARNGHTDIFRLLIDIGADVGKGRDTPLTEAARNGHTDIVRLLIENGADVNKGRIFKDTPLSGAARNGHTDIVRLLIENGADVNKGWISNDTPLSGAARNGHTDIVRLLIENGADVNKGGWDTPLAGAARNGHTDIVRLLIENGADVNKGGWNIAFFEDTPLSAASRNGHTDIVRLLIENGADVSLGWDTPLVQAARNGHTDIVRLLIENEADVNREGRICERTPVTAAVRNGHTDIVRLHKENGADIYKGGGICERTPVTAAARNGHTEIVRLLKENGADINKGGGVSSPTPLAEAAGNGHSDIVKYLLENGADVNKGWTTPLNEAVINNRVDIARLLIAFGADVNKGRRFFRHSPLREAVRTANSDMVKLLVDNGADFNITSWSAIEMKQLGRILRRKFDADARAVIQIKLIDECLRGMFKADSRDTKLSMERELDVQLKGKKTTSLPKSPGKKLKTQTEMTISRNIVEEGKCGKDSMADVELGLNCLRVSPDRVTLTDVGNAKQGHCVVVEKAKTHPSGNTIIIYGRKINEEGSGVGEAFQLATKDLKGTWEDEEMIAENVQIGSVVKYIEVGDEFLFQGNTKRPRWDMDRIFLDLSCTDGAHRSIGDAFPSSKLLAVDSCQDCTPKETSYFSSLKCDVVENDRISVITKLGELLNLKLNYRDVILHLSSSTLELSHVDVNKDVVDGAVVKMREPLLISGVDGLSKPSYPVLGEGLNLRDELIEASVEAEKPKVDPEEKDDEDGNAF